MNKKLIGLAVASAFAAPVAMAQTANPVTLYGLAWVSVESVEAGGGTAAKVVRRNRVADRVSLFGIRGTEDLGGGLKAWFQLETAFSPDSAAGNTFATRNSGVGLQGGWGSLLLGRWDAPMKVALGAADVWGDRTFADWTAAAMRQGGMSTRLENTVQWWSPNWSGMTVRVAYAANEGKTATMDPHQYGASIAYAKGPFYGALAYEKHKESIVLVATDNVDEEGVAGTLAFTFGKVKITGNYGEFKRTGTDKQKGYYIGLDAGVGAKGHILASFQNSKDGGASGTAQPSCDVWGVGYRHDFSRRTFFLAEYAEVKNKVGSLCNFGQGTLAISAGQDPKGLALGVRHTF